MSRRSALESLRRQDAAVTVAESATPRNTGVWIDFDKVVAENKSLLIMVGCEAGFNGVVLGRSTLETGEPKIG
jgi:hypothetical protein